MFKIITALSCLFLSCCKQLPSTKPKLSFRDSLIVEQLAVLDSCVHLKKISDLDADEVYRFSHGEAFCFYRQRVTVTRTNDSISLHYLEYSGTNDGNLIEYRDKTGLKRFGPGCRIEKEFYKSIAENDWKGLEEKIEEADYWRIEESNNVVRDGSFWHIDSYLRKPENKNGPKFAVFIEILPQTIPFHC
jgi:hypothetical protein